MKGTYAAAGAVLAGCRHVFGYPITPSTEGADSAILSIELAFKYRNPGVIFGGGDLGQMTGKVRLPDRMVVPGIPEWAVYGGVAPRTTNGMELLRPVGSW